jgi:hypothetical protein
LEFWASSETDVSVSDSVDTVRHSIEPYLNMAFSQSILSTLEITLRFVPIIMRPEWALRYPARSKARIKARVYDCAPQLDYEIFVSGCRQEQVAEYIRGVELSAQHLPKFGATRQQVDVFLEIMAEARFASAKGLRPLTRI